MQSMNAIQALIQSKCFELNMTYKDLIRASGYKNVPVGLKRLNQLFNADYDAARGLIEKLLPVLNLTLEQIKNLILETKQQQALEAEISYQNSFVPHFIIRTANRGRPKHIFFAGLLNASQYVQDNFSLDMNPQNYIKHALEHLKTHQNSIDNFYYAPVDIVINYAYDKTEVVSLSGQHISYLDKSVPNGTLTIHLK